MGHNVWSHINAVQQANRKYDEGTMPAMLVDESFDRVYFRDVVEAIFATDNRDEANAIIEEFNKFWMSIIGTRGAVGKKTVNAFIKGVSEDTIELIEESLIFDVDSVKDRIKTLLRAFMMIININNFRIFNKTEIKVISSAKKKSIEK